MYYRRKVGKMTGRLSGFHTGVPPDFGGKLNVSSPTPRASWQKVGIGRVTAYPSIRCNDATFCQFAHRAPAIHPLAKIGRHTRRSVSSLTKRSPWAMNYSMRRLRISSGMTLCALRGFGDDLKLFVVWSVRSGYKEKERMAEASA